LHQLRLWYLSHPLRLWHLSPQDHRLHLWHRLRLQYQLHLQYRLPQWRLRAHDHPCIPSHPYGHDVLVVRAEDKVKACTN
jgi:hypothetical protein